MATLEQLSAALVKADAAGNAEDAKALADAIRQMRTQSEAAQPRGVASAEAPGWAKEYPSLYSAAVTTRRVLGPTVEMLGGIGGGLVGGAAGTVAGPAGTAAGGVAGAGLGYGTAKSALRNIDVALGLQQPESVKNALLQSAADVLEGATYETGGRVAAPVISGLGWLAKKGAGGVGTLMDIRQLPNQLASKVARESLGTPAQVAAARQAMQATEAQGLNLTAQQALARGGVTSPATQAVLEKAIRKTGAVDVRAAKEAAQEASRMSTLKAITPELDDAIAARRAAAAPLYKAADEATVVMDKDLASVFDRMPTGTLSKAAEIAKMEGRPFIMGKTAPAQMVETGVLDAAGRPVMKEVPAQQAQITGESLHYVKRALSDLAYGPTAATGAGRDAQLAARSLLDDYVKVFESKVPDYRAARQTFSDLSAPVNQAQVLKEMVSVLEKPGGGERIGPFLNVLGRGEQAMLKRAGGRGAPRFEALNEVLTPEQLSTVREVARQLETQASVGKQIPEGQLRATELLKDELPNLRLPNVFNILATTANKVLDILSGRISEKTLKKLADASLSAKTFDELLNTLPGEERSKVLKAISDPNTWAAIKPAVGKAAMGVSAVNQLAPEREPQNALVQ